MISSIIPYAEKDGETECESRAKNQNGSPRAIVFDGVEVMGVYVAVAMVVRDEVYFDSLGRVAGAGGEEAGDEEKSCEQELCELGGEMRMDSAPGIQVEVHCCFRCGLK